MSEPEPAVETLRLFVAIDAPPPVREVLAELPQPLRGVSWTPPHQYHLTLRFLGEVPADRLERIEAALAPIRVEPFFLAVESMGTFPPRRPPRVIWSGVGHGHPRLFQLRQKVDDALLTCWPELDVRTFHPHFTLGRCGNGSSPADVTRFVHRHEDFEGPSFRVDAFTLYRSTLQPGGAIHTPLLRVDLNATTLHD